MKNFSRIKKLPSLAKQTGLTIIEATFVLLLLLGVILYAVDKYTDGQQSSNLNQEQSNLVSVIGKIKSKYNTASDFTGATIDTLRNSEVFPDTMISGTTVHSLLGGTITAGPVNAVGSNDGLALTIPGYSKKACNGITERVESSVYSMTINGTSVKAANAQLDRAAVGTACAAGANTMVITITKV